MSFTDFHAKYFAHELTKRCPSDSVEKLAPVLADARVDLNPHQIDAALFAFRSPFSRGALLADEVGLGKTIEAALLLARKWAEKGAPERQPQPFPAGGDCPVFLPVRQVETALCASNALGSGGHRRSPSLAERLQDFQ
jgi:hypothetical protein